MAPCGGEPVSAFNFFFPMILFTLVCAGLIVIGLRGIKKSN